MHEANGKQGQKSRLKPLPLRARGGEASFPWRRARSIAALKAIK